MHKIEIEILEAEICKRLLKACVDDVGVSVAAN